LRRSEEDIASTIRERIGIEKIGGEVCHGTVTAVMVGCFVIASYLALFIRFFIQTYSTKTVAKDVGGKKKVKKTQ
jgi:hypothetical protein